ncbi:DNA adenine methylase [Candidatus Spongiihabitans sp.]|uniref:DNA adenine methylase n=1 Tax=Candidatus Spongiihabitans sp. TaxID=3101308 RepID=UPI003C6F7F6C
MWQTNLEIDFATDIDRARWANIDRRMPASQYLGAKYKLLPWLCEFIPVGIDTVLDGFSGSQSFSFEMKKRNYTVRSNDFLGFCHIQGVALVENKQAVLTDGDLDMLFCENKNRGDTMLRFKNIFFLEDECVFLDDFRANVELLDCPHKRSLALAIMCRSLTRKTIMGHFAHLRALSYAKDPARIKRNPSIVRPIRDLFVELLPKYNAAIFDNGKKNKSYRENILDLLPKLQTDKVDLAYYDPPYCNSHADYQAFYHLLETFVESWGDSDKKFINRNQRYHPPRHSGFDKASEIEDSFRKLFALSDEIPHWLISYNDRSLPKIETLVSMAKRHKSVRVEEKAYATSRGGKGSVSGSREYLMVCS